MRHIDLDVSDLPEGRPIRVEDGQQGIVVVREGDRVAAFEDVCPHAQWRLSDGEVNDGILECPGHAWEFSVHSGQCVTVPAYCLKPVGIVRNGSSVRLVVETESGSPVSQTVERRGQALV